MVWCKKETWVVQMLIGAVAGFPLCLCHNIWRVEKRGVLRGTPFLRQIRRFFCIIDSGCSSTHVIIVLSPVYRRLRVPVVYLGNRWKTLWKISKSEKDTIKMGFTELVVRLLNRIKSFMLAGFGSAFIFCYQSWIGCVLKKFAVEMLMILVWVMRWWRTHVTQGLLCTELRWHEHNVHIGPVQVATQCERFHVT
jgi:hypothetical protein